MTVWCCILALPLATAALPSEQALFAAVIADVDRDGDGMLDAVEFARVGTAAGFAAADLDGDGHVRAEELAASTRATHIGPAHRPTSTPAVSAVAPSSQPDESRTLRLTLVAVLVGAASLTGGALLRARRPGRRVGPRGRRR